MTTTPEEHAAASSASWLDSYRRLSDERILTLMDMLPTFETDMSANLRHVVQVAEERGLLNRYGGMMPNERLETALQYVKDPEKLAWLQALARKRGLMPPEPKGDAARGEALLSKIYGSTTRTEF